MKFYNFEIVVEKEAEDEGYSAYSPTLPGCFSNGKTIEEARQNIRKAIQQHIASLLEHGQSVPQNENWRLVVKLDHDTLRTLTLALGAGTVLFGAVPLIAPRWFASAAGLPLAESPAAEVVIRSVSARDAVNGIGILSATLHGGRVAPWILARALADGTDTLGIALAWRAGARNPRLLGLGAIALGATILDVVLYLAHKSAARTPRLPGTIRS